jgi:hypothetical protein
MADTAAEKEEKEKRRKKQAKRMGKVLARAWQLDDSEDFQDGSAGSTAVLCLTAIGKKIDAAEEYRLGRHGWEDFARDLGGVYNRHIQRYAHRCIRQFVQPCVEAVLKTCWRQYISKNTILHDQCDVCV